MLGDHWNGDVFYSGFSPLVFHWYFTEETCVTLGYHLVCNGEIGVEFYIFGHMV